MKGDKEKRDLEGGETAGERERASKWESESAEQVRESTRRGERERIRTKNTNKGRNEETERPRKR